MIKTTIPAGGLHNEEDLQIWKQGKSACSLSSFREHSMRAGKARVWQVYLAVRLCGFPTALFTKYSQPCHARLAFRGMCQLEKDIKNAGSRWTARKVIECTLVEYSFLECYIDKIHYTDYLSFRNLNKLFRLIPIPPILGSRISASFRILPTPPFNSFFTLKS